MSALPISFDDVRAASARIGSAARKTPVITSRDLDQRLGATVFLKAELFQRGGAFKFRGAYNKVKSLPAHERARGVVAASSGNHAQALAIAAGLADTQATVLMPSDAPPSKRAAAEAYGATIVEFDRRHDDRESLTARLAEQHGLTIVHAYDDPHVIAGAGTATLELLDEVGPLDIVVIPLGGGGLLSGGSVAASGFEWAPRIVGVEPLAVGAFRASLGAGRPVTVDVGQTIADGQRLSRPGALTFAAVSRLVDRIEGVGDEQILQAMRYLFERQKLVVEPSGSSALAALLSGSFEVTGQRVGVILSGGNIDVARFQNLMSRGA